MAVVTETAAPINVDLRDTAFAIELFAPEREEVAAVASDPENPTLAERLFVRVNYAVIRSDGRHAPGRVSDWVHIDDAISTFDPGDAAALRALLVKVYNAGKTLADLD